MSRKENEPIVVFHPDRVVDYVLLDYRYPDGSGHQRFFGTDVILGEW